MPSGITPNTGSFFFGRAGQAREGTLGGGPGGFAGGGNAPNLIPPSDKATTLFVGGLGRDLSDRELQNSLTGAVTVRRPPGKSFAFVEFASHQAAKLVVEASVRRGVVLGGRTISIGWGKEKEKEKTEDSSSHYGAGSGSHNHGVSSSSLGDSGIFSNNNHGDSGFVVPVHLQPPSEDCKTLFIGSLALATTREKLLEALPHSVEVRRKPGKAFAFVEFETHEAAAEVVRVSQEQSYVVDERSIAIGWAKNFNHDLATSTSTSTSGGGDGGEDGGAGGEADSRPGGAGTNKRKFANLQPPDSEAKTLFVGGLAHTVTVKDLEAFFEDTAHVRLVEGKDFAFVEFTSPEAAQRTMERGSGKGVVLVLHGKHLSLGWAKVLLNCL
jgi:RNA recognition motif-containing protein